jgi:hypothetical protein
MAIARLPMPELAVAVLPAVGSKSIPLKEICMSVTDAV